MLIKTNAIKNINCYCPYKRPEIKAFERHDAKSIKLDNDVC